MEQEGEEAAEGGGGRASPAEASEQGALVALTAFAEALAGAGEMVATAGGAGRPGGRGELEAFDVDEEEEDEDDEDEEEDRCRSSRVTTILWRDTRALRGRRDASVEGATSPFI